MIEREMQGAVVVLRMAHGKVNALDLELCDGLASALAAEGASDARAVVLTGSGRAFSAGVDLRRLADGGRPYIDRFLPSLERLFRAVLDLPKPLIAAVNGHAIAGGCIAAAGCDHVLLARGPARMGITELAVGVPFPALPLAMMASRVSPSALRALVYGASTYAVDDALRVGLADELCEPDALLPRALELAAKRGEVPAGAYAMTRRMFAEPIYATVARQRAIDDEAAGMWSSDETLASIRRYLASLAAPRA
ncbi:MAG: enoyl-CoA hydratase/isomerase family protein [Polyangiales bacterium]